MAKNKIGLQVSGFEELAERLESVGGDLKQAAEECLVAAHETITPRLHEDMRRHRQSGNTEGNIIDSPQVQWTGNTAEIGIGFKLPEGLASIFLMYGTPRMKKDTKLYQDIYGSRVKKDIASKQEKIFRDAMLRAMEG